ncbi:MAG: endonuclease/exonuclease/phosphatase family protein, partial [Bacteroidales bacterium]
RRLTVLLLLAAPRLIAQTADKISFMTYNIKGHSITDQKIKEIAKVINSVGPEAVSIQEVDMRPYIFRHDYLKDLADSTGMYYEFLPTVGRDYGIGLLSKTKPLSVRTMIVPFTDASKDKENRGILIGEFADYYFISTHYSLNAEDRDAATDSICNFTFSVDKNVIVAGDFNARPTYRAIQTFLNNGFSILNNTSVLTFPSDNPTSCIDMILYFEQGEVLRYRVLNSGIPAGHGVDLATPSDHLPVYVLLRDRFGTSLQESEQPEIRVGKEEGGIRIFGLEDLTGFMLLDMQGRVVISKQIENQEFIAVPGGKGPYLIRLNNRTLNYTVRLII